MPPSLNAIAFSPPTGGTFKGPGRPSFASTVGRTYTSSMPDPPPEFSDGSALCVACGLCCQGVLHDKGDLRDDEVEHAFSIGMIVTRDLKQGVSYGLPCPLLKDTACSVYEERPSACRGYRCGLLQRYTAGEVPIERALSLVNEAKRLLARVLSQLPEGTSLRDAFAAWRARNLAAQRSGSGSPIQAAAAVHLSVTMLQLLLDRQFRAEYDQFEFKKAPGD